MTLKLLFKTQSAYPLLEGSWWVKYGPDKVKMREYMPGTIDVGRLD